MRTILRFITVGAGFLILAIINSSDLPDHSKGAAVLMDVALVCLAYFIIGLIYPEKGGK